MKVIELITFKLKPEVAEKEFAAALADSDRWLALQPGFIMRRHGVSENGRMDYAEWEDMASAKAAAERFCTAPEVQAFLEAIDRASVAMQYYALAS